MTAVGFEPTPFRTSALSWRLRPLGHAVTIFIDVFFSQLLQFKINTRRTSVAFLNSFQLFRSCGPMDKASVYGTGDCRFESYQGHFA